MIWFQSMNQLIIDMINTGKCGHIYPDRSTLDSRGIPKINTRCHIILLMFDNSIISEWSSCANQHKMRRHHYPSGAKMLNILKAYRFGFTISYTTISAFF